MKILGIPLRDIVIGVLASLVATALGVVLKAVWGEDVPKSAWTALGIACGVVVVAGLVVLVERVLMRRIRREVEAEVAADLRVRIRAEVGLAEKERLLVETGIGSVFRDFSECQEEIKAAIQKSNRIFVFLQVGKTIFSGGNDFYDILGRNLRPESQVRILHAGADSPYLTPDAAARVGSNYQEWVDDLAHASRKIKTLMSIRPNVQAAQHREPYLWRVFILDDCAYLQPYLFKPGNARRAPVLKLMRWGPQNASSQPVENERSLYKVVERHFDFKWAEALAREGQKEAAR